MNHINTQSTQEADLARLIVKTLNLDVPAAEIDPQAPLYGEGLGLDSIDMLEIALAVSQQFGVKLRADDKNNAQIFSSLRNLNAFIQHSRGS
ncbi:MAG: phosphopantetheine-binding protein [Stellaceae bacterium]